MIEKVFVQDVPTDIREQRWRVMIQIAVSPAFVILLTTAEVELQWR